MPGQPPEVPCCREVAPSQEQLLSASQSYLQHIKAGHKISTAARRDREARRRKAVADQLALQQVEYTAMFVSVLQRPAEALALEICWCVLSLTPGTAGWNYHEPCKSQRWIVLNASARWLLACRRQSAQQKWTLSCRHLHRRGPMRPSWPRSWLH